MISGIVVALPEELGTLTNKKVKKGSVYSLSENIRVICSGTGAKNAEFASITLVNNGVERLISWGCAAGIHESLQPGHLVLATHCIADDGVLDADLDWLNLVKPLIPQQINMHLCRLAESDHVVATSSEKLKVAQKTGALALDMESTAIAKVAQLYSLPFLVVRAIADPVEMNLPKAVNYALDCEGDVNMAKLLSYLARHPTELAGLIKLGLHFNAAKKTLKLLAKQLDAVTGNTESRHVNSN